MLIIYSRGVAADRNAKTWLDVRGISYTDHFLSKGISREHLIKILSLTERGVEDIVSERTQQFRNLNLDIESLSLSRALELLQQHPFLLKHPIIFNDSILQVGYNEEAMRIFIPSDFRRIQKNTIIISKSKR